MADARGSSSSSGDGGGGEGKGGAGHGDFVGSGQHNWYHGILGAVPPPNVGRQNIVHHQYPAASLIQQHHQSPTMPLPMAQLPYVPQYTVLPTPAKTSKTGFPPTMLQLRMFPALFRIGGKCAMGRHSCLLAKLLPIAMFFTRI
uniref:Uncharacterized protein n=1 Tax=Oryza glumipatula TaxID=40148 RepID=A0A0D9ZSF7_9ORYZ